MSALSVESRHVVVEQGDEFPKTILISPEMLSVTVLASDGSVKMFDAGDMAQICEFSQLAAVAVAYVNETQLLVCSAQEVAIYDLQSGEAIAVECPGVVSDHAFTSCAASSRYTCAGTEL